MASRRPGGQSFGWSGISRPRDTRAGAEPPQEETKLRPGWKTKRVAEPSHQPSRTIPQPNSSSRLPQTHHRRPSDGQPEQARSAVQSSRVRSSVGSVSSVVGDSHGPSSTAPPPSRLPAPSLKPRNILRRKRSGLSQDTTNTHIESRNDSTGTTSSDSYPRCQTPLDPFHLDRELTQSPMEIRLAQQIEIPMTKAQTVTIYPELDRYRDVQLPPRSESPGSNLPHRLATHDLPPPTPLFSGTSSQSPGLVAPIRIPPPGTRRPPVTRRRAGSISNEAAPVATDPQGLAVVRELSTSSSSNSTVRAGVNAKDKKKSKGSSHRAPSPPPRKSSHKPKESRDGVVASKVSRKAPPTEAASPPAVKPTSFSRPRLVQPTPPTGSSKLAPPRRPSRDGTADLQPQSGQTIPVIHSNLSSTSLSERRQSGLLAPGPANRPIVSTAAAPERPSYLSRRPPTREPTPTPNHAASRDVVGTSKQEPARPTRTPSPNVSSTFKTRFPIFGRRTKTVPDPSQQDKKDKPARKGPAAGTGHEGYGKLGSVRRRSNSLTNAARVIPGTMSSQESLSSLSRDSFLLERMAPVVIAGGEIIENKNASSELTRVESNQSSTLRRPSIESRNSSQVSLSSSREAPRKTLWPSPFPRNASQTPSLSSRRPSESSDSEAVTMKPTLALRRSMQRLKAGEQEPAKLPKPIITQPQAVSPAMGSLDVSIMSDDSVFDPSAEPAVATKEPANPASTSGPKKLIRRARSPRKWNFFGRSHSQAPAEKTTDTAKTVAATVQVVQNKPVAFYTMMDSPEQDDSDPIDLEEVLREARGIATTTPEFPQVEDPSSRRPSVANQSPPSVPTPQQPEVQRPLNTKRAFTSQPALPVSPRSKVEPTPAQPPATHAPTRPSRLPQVGRIPKVISARAEQTSPKSFSRPFHRLSVQVPPVVLEPQDQESVAKGPSPPKPSTPEASHDDPLAENNSNISALIYGVPRLPPPASSQPGQEFLSFSPRKDSQCTMTTSSSSSGGLMTFADATAVVPSPCAPLAEDEIWDEYNDLLGEETIKLSTLQGPSWPKPLRLDGSTHKKWIEPALESPTLSPPPLPSLVQTLRAGMDHTSLSVRGSEVALEVKRMLDYEPTPVNSIVVPDTPCSQDDEVNRATPGNPKEDVPSAQRDSCSSALQVRRSNASSSTQCSEDNSPLSQVNLRVGSMTVSKWLTFGHVLFSPVRDELVAEVGSLKRPSILVVDGLGNDDWSFYAAETYPAATFFNLSPRAPLPTEYQNESSFPLSPPNHHQVQYSSNTAKFPFGAQSFTAVVVRFPSAAPEGHYRNIISEARRVLKPGGYIELSILDVDLNNMGNRCRRTVRRLKERIHAQAPDTSLASASDLILRLIGRRGFTDVKTCRVGVPIASNVARSPRSSGNETGGSGGKRRSTGGPAPGAKHKKDERSLPEMIADEGPVADESIAQSVARVGRWWYSRCYESAAGPGIGPSSKGSIWRDKALLAECQEWGTSLKLMVCHARVPDGRARVASI
ncbi:hypothetical protein CHGG_07329 [Chaetomium globosum CBS 148.51]|uniref:Methyltransferase type 11 domain-containing protein n=1 Tax=Chaetomium globosum (strain ATCC 6205 / CBS 148.51 / DSM 1962 / NBRC 6347 / NRRL 1970) TaxID=306901 RepID=Q2GXH5_CHAGB|nr:uncharacterized protein CHGG_07329 [Chaetomium globosum CBS 148.51]EAQ86076.1 hypothetical protein CHGG_07329 [Chaetomium globosum CBS 148.51]